MKLFSTSSLALSFKFTDDCDLHVESKLHACLICPQQDTLHVYSCTKLCDCSRQLVASSITELTTYTDLADYSSQHPHHLLLLEADSNSEGKGTATPHPQPHAQALSPPPPPTNTKQSLLFHCLSLYVAFPLEYAALLSAILSRPLPLAVAVTANVLPLSRRPHFSKNPPPLRMWYVMKDDSGEWWYPFHETGLILQDDINRNKPPAQLVEEFIERFQYPIIVSVDMRILCVHISLSLSLSLSARFTMKVMPHCKRSSLAVVST